ncbi:MAG: bacillithiol biosynthesis cysteine-adding enzyme BshC [Cyclobacteriaceae bacterium]
MTLDNINLEETGSFSPIFIKYLNEASELKPFYGLPPKISSFEAQIEQKQFPKSHRKTLCEVLNAQYDSLDISDNVTANLEALQNDNTFTITTGHQLNICTGPLYFLYKIVTVVNACKSLKKAHPDKEFVPVYWMASEDHDLDEIDHFFLYGKEVKWETDQTGAVGRMDPKSLDQIFDQLPEIADVFIRAYSESKTLADAVRYYVNELFGESGVVVIDADDKRLKAEFAEVIKDDLINNTANNLVEACSGKLDEMGFKTQVFPREINFFLLEQGSRDRILHQDGVYGVKSSSERYSKEEILKLVDSNPEKFSPNVILRPLYQETILPNLAYVGGPAEVAYWLQLKPVFDHYKTSFPVLMPRNFGLIITRPVMRKIEKTGISSNDLFKPFDQLKADYIKAHTDNEIHLENEVKRIQETFENIRQKAVEVDPTLDGFVGAECAKTVKSLENIEKRIHKSEERNQEVAVQQLDSIKNKLFPNGSLQERRDNFLNFYVNNRDLIDQLLDKFDAFDFSMHILKEEEVAEPAA